MYSKWTSDRCTLILAANIERTMKHKTRKFNYLSSNWNSWECRLLCTKVNAIDWSECDDVSACSEFVSISSTYEIHLPKKLAADAHAPATTAKCGRPIDRLSILETKKEYFGWFWFKQTVQHLNVVVACRCTVNQNPIDDIVTWHHLVTTWWTHICISVDLNEYLSPVGTDEIGCVSVNTPIAHYQHTHTHTATRTTDHHSQPESTTSGTPCCTYINIKQAQNTHRYV